MSTSKPPPDDSTLRTVAAEQRRHLTTALDLASDLDLAFHLQLEEAIAASLSLRPSTSSSSSPPKPQLSRPNPPNDAVLTSQTIELDKLVQELDDKALIEAEMDKLKIDLNRWIHDHKFAQEIQSMPEDEWEEEGENFENPFGEGSSQNNVVNEVFRVYFKGLVSEELIGNSSSKVKFAGIGAAICDSRDQLIFEVKKPVIEGEMSRRDVEFKALIEGLNAAIALDLKRIVFYCDYFPLYQFVTGRWHLKQRRIATLVNQVSCLRNKFNDCRPSLVARNDIKFAFKFAREAILSQINKPSSSSSSNQTKNENCVICFEDTDVTHMFSVDVCKHRYCFSCMRQHIEMKLRIGMVPKCPHEGCNSQLQINSCKKFLTPKLIEHMSQRLKEASIPPTEKIYCPYPKCSALMTKTEVFEYSKTAIAGAERLGARVCIKCGGHFCVNCKVPWHKGMSCSEYKRKVPNPGDAKLKTLAERNLWRQCVKCNHMIELVAGCYHMTCRCGYEFCYTCGAEWKNKKATCACPLWDEQNILDDNDDEDDEEYEFDGDGFNDDDESEYYDSDSDDYN